MNAKVLPSFSPNVRFGECARLSIDITAGVDGVDVDTRGKRRVELGDSCTRRSARLYDRAWKHSLGLGVIGSIEGTMSDLRWNWKSELKKPRKSFRVGSLFEVPSVRSGHGAGP